MISDGNKFIEVKLIKLYTSPNFYECMYNYKYSYMKNQYYYSYTCMYLCLINMKVLKFKDFMKKIKLINDTMNESELQIIYNYPIYPRDSKIYSDKGFINIDNGSQGGTHWTCFIGEDNKSYYCESFGGQPDKVLLKQLPKPIIYLNYYIQDITSKLCGSYCLYSFYLIERMNYYDAILKMYFN